MGAWGHGPFDNDYALDWIEGCVQPTVLTLLSDKMEECLKRGREDDTLKHEAESAVALLLLLSNPSCTFSQGINVPEEIGLLHLARAKNAFDSATAIIDCLIADKNWIQDWSDPDLKLRFLRQMQDMLRRLKNGEKNGDIVKS